MAEFVASANVGTRVPYLQWTPGFTSNSWDVVSPSGFTAGQTVSFNFLRSAMVGGAGPSQVTIPLAGGNLLTGAGLLKAATDGALAGDNIAGASIVVEEVLEETSGFG